MAGTTRLLRTTRALQSDHSPSFSSSSSCHLPPLKFPSSGGEKQSLTSSQGRKRVAVSSDTAVVLPETKKKPSVQEAIGNADLCNLIAKVASASRTLLNPKLEMKHWRTYTEMLVERGITGCRSFTLTAVAGSLVGSILCFVEGCFFVLEAFYQYFQTVSSRMDQGRIIQSLVEAIDMFLVGTALLTFGIGMYVTFARSAEMKQKGWQNAESRFGSFNLEKLADSMEMQSISQAKSRLGHAILLILQAGVVDKFKNVQVASGLDLACFAGAVFISSACVFLLSKLTIPHGKNAFA
ncbi:hypothetical protein Cni_G00926 [Canna indica]|uniref:Uncharacterized protein n=1 Tax=Canna indica TaxID=4628 RepID=A0AAQ3PXG8_9LILI|nr:hypothetical protein Cni_G00926 [Canna indica]